MGLGDKSIEYITRKAGKTEVLVKDWGARVETEAKTNYGDYWKTNTNHAAQSLHGGHEIRNLEDMTIYVSHGMKYGRFLEEGTPPHLIRAKNKPYLKFRVGKQFVTTKAVRHPGTKPRPLLRDTLERNIPRIKKSLSDLWANE